MEITLLVNEVLTALCIEVKGSLYMEQRNLVDSYQLFRSIRSRSVVVCIATTIPNQRIVVGKKISLLLSIQTNSLTQSTTQRLSRAVSPLVKLQGRKADCSSTSSSKFRDDCSYT